MKRLRDTTKQINDLEENISSLGQDALKNKTNEFKSQLKEGRTLSDILPEAFACVREASKRTLGMRHFDVQLMGGIVLHMGMISEMQTGEGKTLVATLAAYLNALEEKGVHIVTVNDYLAKRDADWMKQIYRYLGLEVACVTSDMKDAERANGYKADITYATNNELGFDYLRDNMKFDRSEMVQRELHFAIVDEVDSILIDEARTPLIISGPTNRSTYLYSKIDKLVRKLDEKLYTLDEKHRTAFLSEEGQEEIEKLLIQENLLKADDSLYDPKNLELVHCINQSLKALTLFHRDKDYIVKDGQIVIIDEFTGRMMEGRRYSEGIHQALEAKEHLKVQSENHTLASITFQNYFRMYSKLSGMTGTAATESEELMSIYGLEVIQIPTHLPVQRVDHDDEIYGTKSEKYQAIIELVKKCKEKSQPVLIGTISIEQSEVISDLLLKEKLRHAVLNAKHHESEAEIIAQAGKPGAITIATNMAGRGTDIQLGGHYKKMVSANEESEPTQYNQAKEEVKQAGGLYVIGTERHESRRIDNQLRGRSGRQGDPGESKFFLSLEDDLLRIFGTPTIRNILKKQLIGSGAIKHSYITRSLERAQKKVESRNYEIRKNLIRLDDVINEQRKVIFSHRNSIIENDDIDLLPIAESLTKDLLKEAYENNFYDIEMLQNTFSNICEEDFSFLSTSEDIEQSLNDRVAEIIQNKEKEYESTYKDTKLLSLIKKRITIGLLDQLWQEHIQLLENLRMTINLKAVAQKNPIIEFKHEAFNAFQNVMKRWNKNIITAFIRVKISDIHNSAK